MKKVRGSLSVFHNAAQRIHYFFIGLDIAVLHRTTKKFSTNQKIIDFEKRLWN